MNKLYNNALLSQVYFHWIIHFLAERGKALGLIKPSSKRKRTRSEIEEVKEEEKLLKTNKQEFLKETKKLKLD